MLKLFKKRDKQIENESVLQHSFYHKMTQFSMVLVFNR